METLMKKRKKSKSNFKTKIKAAIDTVSLIPKKLNPREKRLIIALLILILGGAYYKFFMASNLHNMSLLKDELLLTTAHYDKMIKDISEDNSVHSDYKNSHAKAYFLSREMFTNFDQERIIELLDHIIKDTKLNVVTISFNRPSIVSVKKEETVEDEKTTLQNKQCMLALSLLAFYGKKQN